jgi:RNase adaptor protein for sRNA GlmZ degradation
MKLLIIYGSSAVGKLTTALEIAKRTDFKVFHNHLTIDVVKPIFEFGTVPFWKLVHQYRIEMFKEAAKQNVNLVFTFCYAKDDDDEILAKKVNAIKDNGGEVCFVLLTADKKEIEKRVVNESRLKYHKANSVENLRRFWEMQDMFSPVNNYESLIIDNTNSSAEETANQIIQYFQLDLT